MPNENKSKSQFIELKATCTYRVTFECEMKDYQHMIESMESYTTVVKEEIETEV